MDHRLDDYVDEWGMVVKDHRGGGDSAHRVGFIKLGLEFLRSEGLEVPEEFKRFTKLSYLESLSVLECPNSPGNFRRHPANPPWASECNRFSRDQATSLLMSMGYEPKAYPSLCKFFKAHLRRGLLFMTNTRRNGATRENHGTEFKKDGNGKPVFRNYNWKLPDLTGPEFWALYIRAFRIKWMYPLLYILDLETLISVYSRIKNAEDNDDLNLICILVNAHMTMPTVVSKFALRTYILKRPRVVEPHFKSEFYKLYGSNSGPESAIYKYFDKGIGEPPLYKLWVPILRRLKFILSDGVNFFEF